MVMALFEYGSTEVEDGYAHGFVKLSPPACRSDHRRNKYRMRGTCARAHQSRSTPRIKEEKNAKASIEILSSRAEGHDHVNIPWSISMISCTYFQAKTPIPTSTSTRSSKGNAQIDGPS